MLAKLKQHRSVLTKADAERARHLLVILPKSVKATGVRDVPFSDALRAALARRSKKLADLAKAPVTTDVAHGALVSWVMDDANRPLFERQTMIRKALQPLLAEHPQEVSIALYGSAEANASAGAIAVYAAWVNGVHLPVHKKKKEGKPLGLIRVYGHEAKDAYASQRAQAEGNVLCRELTVLPPNELTPGAYRERIRKQARAERWTVDELDMKRLRKMGARFRRSG